MTEQERDWLERSRRGDVDAFGHLVDAHEGWLRAMLRARLTDWTAADDLAQEAFVTAFQRIRQFRGESSFATWLRGIALNHLRNFVRRKKELLVGGEALASLLEQGGPEHLPEDSLEALRLCLAQLPGASRSLLEARYVEEQSVKSLAASRSMGYSAMTMQLHRLRLALARCIESRLNPV